ncbi:hypothetical protein ACFL34_04885 [Candidatus Sumerlaeota bacterium]
MDKTITTGFRELEESLKRMKTLLAWQDLEQREYRSPAFPPSAARAGEDLNLEAGHFWVIARRLDILLERSRAAPDGREREQLRRSVTLFRQIVRSP